MSHSLAHHTRRDLHQVVSIWWTLHWTILVTLAVVLIAVLFVGVRVAQ